LTKPQPSAPGKGVTWRPLTKRERTPTACAAVELQWGDCSQQPAPDSVYCVYHTKVAVGLINCFADYRGREVPPQHYYPVFPLPLRGYALLNYEGEAA
jgi:hypothetical protein